MDRKFSNEWVSRLFILCATLCWNIRIHAQEFVSFEWHRVNTSLSFAIHDACGFDGFLCMNLEPVFGAAQQITMFDSRTKTTVYQFDRKGFISSIEQFTKDSDKIPGSEKTFDYWRLDIRSTVEKSETEDSFIIKKYIRNDKQKGFNPPELSKKFVVAPENDLSATVREVTKNGEIHQYSTYRVVESERARTLFMKNGVRSDSFDLDKNGFVTTSSASQSQIKIVRDDRSRIIQTEFALASEQSAKTQDYAIRRTSLRIDTDGNWCDEIVQTTTEKFSERAILNGSLKQRYTLYFVNDVKQTENINIPQECLSFIDTSVSEVSPRVLYSDGVDVAALALGLNSKRPARVLCDITWSKSPDFKAQWQFEFDKVGRLVDVIGSSGQGKSKDQANIHIDWSRDGSIAIVSCLEFGLQKRCRIEFNSNYTEATIFENAPRESWQARIILRREGGGIRAWDLQLTDSKNQRAVAGVVYSVGCTGRMLTSDRKEFITNTPNKKTIECIYQGLHDENRSRITASEPDAYGSFTSVVEEIASRPGSNFDFGKAHVVTHILKFEYHK